MAGLLGRGAPRWNSPQLLRSGLQRGQKIHKWVRNRIFPAGSCLSSPPFTLLGGGCRDGRRGEGELLVNGYRCLG